MEKEETKIIECPICQSQDLRYKKAVPDHSISKETFNIFLCLNCNFHFTNPQPRGRNLDRYYESEDYISHTGTKRGLVNKLYHLVQRKNLRSKYGDILPYVPRGTWMDYGAGNGAFLEYLKQKKVEAVGYEPHEGARKIASERNVEVLNPSIYITDKNKYACITLWHVLEHIPDLNEIIELHSLHLIKDGILVIALPNYQSYDAAYYKSYWAAYDVPRHLWHFSEETIKMLLSKHGFEMISKKPMYFDSYYVSLLSEKYKKGYSIKALILGALSNIYARFSDYPYSSQIYIFRKKEQ